MKPPTCADRLLRQAAAVLAFGLAVAACSNPTPPEVSVSCRPGSIEVVVQNVSETTARYTVTIESTRDDLTESVQMSTNDVAPNESVTLTEPRPDEPTTCRVTEVEVFEQ